MQKIVGVRKGKNDDLVYFVQNIDNLKLGDRVVVNYDEFQTIAVVSKLGLTVSDDKANELKRLIRVANEVDIFKFESQNKKARDFLPKIKQLSLSLGLMMKFISAEYSLDNTKILIMFSSEERVDFRQLLKELATRLRVRIELRQIGQRDEVKLCGSVGICGQQCCCSRFLTDFEHVTVKMAKVQGLSLSPTKINGACGRLMCCLGYESGMYEEMLKNMPKVGSEIVTPNGKGTVVYNDILRERVSVKRQTDGENSVIEDFTLEELKSGKREKTDEIDEKRKISEQVDEFLQKNTDFNPNSIEKQSEEPATKNVKNNNEKNASNENVKQNVKNNNQNNFSQNNNQNNNQKNRNKFENKNNNFRNENRNQNSSENVNQKQRDNSGNNNFEKQKNQNQNAGMTIVRLDDSNMYNNDSGTKNNDNRQGYNDFKNKGQHNKFYNRNKNYTNK